jgi:hypothetical protein
MWTKYQQLLKMLTPEASREQLIASSWRAVRTQIYENMPFFGDIISHLPPPNTAEMNRIIEMWKFTYGKIGKGQSKVHAITGANAAIPEQEVVVNTPAIV